MMTKIAGAGLGVLRALLVASLVMLNFSLPARAQFSQGNVITGAAGTANAQTGTLANATSYASILNVLLIYVPAASNTGSATLALSGLGGALAGGPITFEKPNGAGLTPLVGGELVTGQPEIIRYDGTYMDVLGPVTLPITAGNLANSALSFDAPPNLQINGAVGSNQLTISVVGNNGSAATAANPIPVAFRDTTIGNGDPIIESLTGALSFTINSGNTMGCVSAKMCRLWEFLANNGGTIVLCAYNANDGNGNIEAISESNLQTASGTNGGSAAQTLYCNASISAVAVRYIGYVDIQETVAGTWATGPNKIQLFGPGVFKPGETYQTWHVDTATVQGSSSASFPTATTFTQQITLHSAANVVRAKASMQLNTGSAGSVKVQLYWVQSGTFACTNASGQPQTTVVSGTSMEGGVALFGRDVPNTTSLLTYGVCFGVSTAAGNVGPGMLELDEVQGALDLKYEPSNDDVFFKMVG
jgi:hypothetical protein